MKIRFGLVLILALGLGMAGCAAGGAAGPSSGGMTPSTPSTPGAAALAQGERPRNTENTRVAQRALDDADEAEDPAEARQFYQQALEAAEAGIAEDPRNPLPYRQAALANLGLENYEAAGQRFDEAAELRPIYAFEDAGIRERAWIDLYQEAIPLVNGGDYEAAIPVFENANHIYQDRPEVMFTLGRLYAQTREHDKALEQMDMAMAIVESPRIEEMDSTVQASWREQAADVPQFRGAVLADAGRLEEAAEVFREISMANPDDVLAKRNLAGILVQMGREAEAFEVYEELMTRPELTASDFYTIGVGFYNGNAYDRAADAFGGAAERNVNDRDAIEMWARSLQLDSAYMEIPEVADRWIELDPNSANAHLIYAQAANQNGDEDTARDMVRAIEALTFEVRDLQITRYSDGGARVTGSVTNKTLDAGSSVTLEFTFYRHDGTPMGTQSTQVQLAGQNMAAVFSMDFGSMDMVGGYGYTVGM